MSGKDTLSVLMELAAERHHQEQKHGDQSHLPDGTGPDRNSLAEFWSYGTNLEVAEQAKARTKAASYNEGGDGSITWEMILTEEWLEAVAEEDPLALRAELIQVAAVAVAWIEAIDGRD